MSERGHLTEAERTAFRAGILDADARATLMDHASSCDECLAQLETTMVTMREGPPRAVEPERVDQDHTSPVVEADQLERGSAVGRYIVIGVLGQGGMGVVYTAYDPELDRKVAVKLLQANPAGGSAGGDPAWLVREAQAMARLSHPNVIAVHDVGSLPGDRVFVAMELVEGMTLRAWLKARPRTWREVLPVLHAAGSGLAAAHAAGLVHRDFKPDNVLVGDDGRVRVMDFGLARLREHHDTPSARTSDLEIANRSPLTESLTIAGAVVGTPAYMAPEIFKAKPADARSDQFGFGVVLYEALFRARPYDKELLETNALTLPKAPAESGVPARIQRIAMRAIAPDPDHRFRSMDALLLELGKDPTAARRRAVMIAGALVAVLGITGAVVATRGSHPQLCKGADRRLAAVWDPATKLTVREAFLATKHPYAAQVFVNVERALDAYAKDWTETSTESCEAARIRGDQTEEVMSLRQTCLDQRLEELRAFTQVLANADAELVGAADKAASSLEPIRQCSNVVALRASSQPTAEMMPKLVDATRGLATAKAEMLASHFVKALLLVSNALSAVKQLHFEPLEAELIFERGSILVSMGAAAQAAPIFAEATWLGLRSHRDGIAAQAALYAALVAAESGKDGEARVWFGLAEATAQRAGVDRTLDQRRLEVEGIVTGDRGDMAAAVAAHEKALATAVATFGVDNIAVARTEQLLATTLTKSGAYAEAIPHYEHAVALTTASGGPTSADIALELTGLAACYMHAGDSTKARTALARALAIREAIFGADSPTLIATLNNQADLLRQGGDTSTALAEIDRALKIAKISPGTSHPLYHTVATTRGEVLLSAGRVAEARVALEDALALEDEGHSPLLPTTLTSRAEVALAEKKWAQAARFDERAIAGFEAAGGKDQPELWRPLTGLAHAKLALGDRVAARPLLERAITIGEKARIAPSDLAPARAALAKLAEPRGPR